ncbi:hypothetical protein SUGI_0753920 [Cryptomeria japonica]|nr:hypothetical protein SUGI_0753920 [Cryptomeria japonica]
MKKQQSPNQCTYVCMASAATQKGSVTSLAVKGSLFYVGSQSGPILIYEKAMDGFLEFAQLHCKAPVKTLAIGENRLFGELQDTKLKVWSHHSDKSLKLLTKLPTVQDRIVRSIKPGSYVQTRRHHKKLWIKHADAVSCLALCLEDDLLYSVSCDKTVKVWRLSDFKCVEFIRAHEDAVNDIACARKGGIFFTASADGTVPVWRSDHRDHHRHHSDHRGDDRLVATLVQSREDAVNCLELSPDESILYSGTSAGQINYWIVDTSLQKFNKGSFLAHKRSVLCLTTLQNFVCSGSADATIRMWWRGEGIAHTCVAVMEGHSGRVKCIIAAMPAVSLGMSSSFSSSSSSSFSSSSSSAFGTCCHCPNYHLLCSGFVVYSGSVDSTLKMWWVGDNDCKVCATAQSGRPFQNFSEKIDLFKPPGVGRLHYNSCRSLCNVCRHFNVYNTYNIYGQWRISY